MAAASGRPCPARTRTGLVIDDLVRAVVPPGRPRRSAPAPAPSPAPPAAPARTAPRRRPAPDAPTSSPRRPPSAAPARRHQRPAQDRFVTGAGQVDPGRAVPGGRWALLHPGMERGCPGAQPGRVAAGSGRTSRAASRPDRRPPARRGHSPTGGGPGELKPCARASVRRTARAAAARRRAASHRCFVVESRLR